MSRMKSLGAGAAAALRSLFSTDIKRERCKLLRREATAVFAPWRRPPRGGQSSRPALRNRFANSRSISARVPLLAIPKLLDLFTRERIAAEEVLERSLWSAQRSLKESAALDARLAERSAEHGLPAAATAHRANANTKQRHAEAIQELLQTLRTEG